MSESPTTPFTGTGGNVLPPYQAMTAQQYLKSPNGRYQLSMQGDGNLVLYDTSTYAAIWVADATAAYSSTTKLYDSPAPYTYMQYYLTVVDGVKRRHWVSSPDTYNLDDRNIGFRTYLYLQDDGNLVTVVSNARWASNTAVPQITDGSGVVIIPPGTSLAQGHSYVCGSVSLVFQTDGNLVLYVNGTTVLWASYTQNKGATTAIMQEDGNFVIYDANGRALWNSGTAGYAGAYLQIQSTGSVMVATQNVCWARFGYAPTIKPSKVVYLNDGHSFSYSWDI